MKLDKTLFRAYDLRWIYWKDFDLEWAEIIWKAYWTYLIKDSEKKSALRVVIWRDWRTHSEEIQEAFIAWVQSTWIEVTNIWLAPSPLVYFAICDWEFDGWVNITASHNPKEYNWFKLQGTRADSIFWKQIQEIYQICESKLFIKWTVVKQKYDSYFTKYLSKIESAIWTKNAKKGDVREKIVIDWWNWVAGPFASLLLKYLWYEVIELYCDIDWNFPNHQADPEDESTLEDLKEEVRKQKAFLWIAFDWDWDRIWVVDSFWETYNADKLLILLARDLIKRNWPQTVIYELNITSLLAEEVEKMWGKAVMCKTWHSFVEHEMKKENALLWWENSGHLFFWENYYWFDDALFAAALISKILIRDHKTQVSKHFASLPSTYEYAKKYNVTDTNKFKIIEAIALRLWRKYELNRLDWVRIDFEDRAWCVIRASNTSPKIQARIETRSVEQLDSLKIEIIAVLDKCIEKAK